MSSYTVNKTRPAILDSPRFFDDEPLSEWKGSSDGAVEASIAASKSTVQIDQLWHGGSKESQWPEPQNESDPICIELVRGMDGKSDNSWSVIVDGLRCELVDKQTDAPYPVKRCRIPGGVKRDFLTSETKVRSILLGVRLESEAESPVHVKLETIQKLQSNEMKALRHGSSKRDTVSTVSLIPYRTSNSFANAVKLPYPICSPSKSVLGIVSMEQVKRWQEQTIAKNILNAAGSVYDFQQDKLYIEKSAIYNGLKEDAQRMQSYVDVIQTFNIINPNPNLKVAVAALAKLTKQGVQNATKMTKPVQPIPAPRVPIPDEPSTGQGDDGKVAQNKDFTIGGKTNSVARDLADMFDKMTEYCLLARDVVDESLNELAQSDDEKTAYGFEKFDQNQLQNVKGNTGKSLNAKLSAMRQNILSNESGAAIALFDALLVTKPFVAIKSLLGDIDQDSLKSGAYSIEQSPNGERIVHLDKGYLISTRNFSRRYSVCKDEEVSDSIDGLATGFQVLKNESSRVQIMNEEQKKKLKEFEANLYKEETANIVNEKLPYSFLYDRLQIEKTKQTSVTVIYRVHVEDQDGSIFAVEFEAEEEDGIVANTVYSGHVQDIIDLDAAAERFVDCMFGSANERSRLRVAGNFVAGIGPSSVQSTLENIQRIPTNLKSAFKMLVGFYQGFSIDKVFDKAFDPCLIEDRVGELKLMVRTMLPSWPPTKNDDEANLQEAYKIAKELDDKLKTEQGSSDQANKEIPKTTDSKEIFQLQNGSLKSSLQSTVTQSLATRVDLDDIREVAQQGKQLQSYLTKSSKVIQSTSTSFADLGQNFQSMQILREMQQASILKLEKFKDLKEIKDEDVETMEKLVQELSDIQDEIEKLIIVQPSTNKKVFELSVGTTKRVLPQVIILQRYPTPIFILPENPNPPRGIAYNIESDIDSVKTSWFGKIGFSDVVKYSLIGTALIATGIVFEGLVVAAIAGGGFAAAGGAAAGGAAAGGAAAAGASTSAASATLTAGISQFVFTAFSSATGLAGGTVAGLSIYFKTEIVKNLIDGLKQRLATTLMFNTIELALTRYKADQMRREFYKIALKNLRLVPVALCIKAAKLAMKLYSEQIQKTLQNIGLTIDQARLIKVSFLEDAQERIQFFEHYSASKPLPDKDVYSLHRSEEWTAIPSASYMQVFPPTDVSDALFNAKTRRDIPMNQAIRFAIGRNVSNEPQSTYEMSAKSAFIELVQAVTRARKELRGANLMQTQAEVISILVSNAAKLIKAAYGLKSGITLVTGDDAIWTCVPGGVAARLCLRHLNVFLSWDEKQVRGSQTAIKETLGYWSNDRRAMVDMFADALNAEATRYAVSENQKAIPFHDIGLSTNRAIEMVNSFERTISFMQSDDQLQIVCTVVALAASSFIFPQIKDDWSEEFVQQMYQKIQAYQRSASSFRYQDTTPSYKQEYPLKTRRAVWARRRLETHERRKLQIGNGVDSLIDSLVDLEIESNAARTEMTFYCPMGSDVYGYHNPYMFDVLTTGKHGIYTESLMVTMKNLIGNLYKRDAAPFTIAGYKTVSILGKAMGENVVGYARHPLTLQLDGSLISVQLSTHIAQRKGTIQLSNQGLGTFTLVDYLDAVANMRDVDSLVNNRVARMRSLAYNSERFFHAAGLASSLESDLSPIKYLDFEVLEARDVLAVAIGLSTFMSQTGVSFSNVRVLLKDDLNLQCALEILNESIEKIEASFAKGCKYCFLSELCLSL